MYYVFVMNDECCRLVVFVISHIADGVWWTTRDRDGDRELDVAREWSTGESCGHGVMLSHQSRTRSRHGLDSRLSTLDSRISTLELSPRKASLVKLV